MKSPEFASKWSEHPVRMGDLAPYRMRHPLAGRMRLNLQALNVPQEEDRRFVVAISDSDTASEAALHLLAQAAVSTAERTEAADRRRGRRRDKHGQTVKHHPRTDTRLSFITTNLAPGGCLRRRTSDS